MNTFRATAEFRVTCRGDAEAFEAHLDEVMGYLLDDRRVEDVDFVASLAGHVVEFSLRVRARDDTEAYAILSGALRAAIHAARGHTPDWEPDFELVQSVLRPDALIPA